MNIYLDKFIALTNKPRHPFVYYLLTIKTNKIQLMGIIVPREKHKAFLSWPPRNVCISLFGFLTLASVIDDLGIIGQVPQQSHCMFEGTKT